MGTTQGIVNWLLQEDNPSVRLRTLTELCGLPEADGQVTAARRAAAQALPAARDLSWLALKGQVVVYSLTALAESGLSRRDVAIEPASLLPHGQSHPARTAGSPRPAHDGHLFPGRVLPCGPAHAARCTRCPRCVAGARLAGSLAPPGRQARRRRQGSAGGDFAGQSTYARACSSSTMLPC